MNSIQIIHTAATQPRLVMPAYAFGAVACAGDVNVRTRVSALKGDYPGTSVWSPPTS
jgi:hypothetical protein